MENNNVIEKMVDLSRLPIKNKKIDWKNSVGCIIPFKYGNITGDIQIVGLTNHYTLLIVIDKYTKTPYEIAPQSLKRCEIMHLVYNKIIDMRPDLVQYLDDIDDAYFYSIGSHQPIHTHCPICGYKKISIPSHLSYKGFKCPICCIGFSYPERFMAKILSSLNISFIKEVNKTYQGFEWTQNYRYDFYICYNNQHIIIEMDGFFHKYQQDTDCIKTQLAMQNGYEIIRIDCDYQTVENRFLYIKNNILNSKLSTILPLQNIDFVQCNEDILKECKVIQASILWEQEYKCIKDLMDIFHTSAGSIVKWFKIGKDMGICPSYNAKESNIRSHCKCIAVYNNSGILIDVFRNATQTSQYLKNTFNILINSHTICSICSGKYKFHTCKGFSFSNISYNEYLNVYDTLHSQYKMTEIDNKLNLEEVV